MDLRQLAAVVAVADNRTFSAAADVLHTVQSNVSSHVARLEAELGVQLIDRHDQRLTEEGHAVVERARRIQAELDALIADVAALRSEVVGTVRLGMISTTARWLTPLLLDELAAAHPRVRLVVFEGTTTTLEPAVAGGGIDAAVVNLPTTNRELVARPLFDEDLVLVVASDDPLARRSSVDFAALSDLALLLPAAGTAYRDELDDAASAAGVTLTARAELDGLRLIASLAWRGYGPAILPASAVAAEGDGYVSLPVSGLPARRVGAVVRRGRPSAPTRVALELLEQLTATATKTATRLGLHPPRSACQPGGPEPRHDPGRLRTVP